MRSLVLLLSVYEVDERLVAEFCSAWRWILACEVPVAVVVGDGFMQSVYRLEHEFDRCLQTFRSEHIYHFSVYLLRCEGFVYVAHAVAHHAFGFEQFELARLVDAL